MFTQIKKALITVLLLTVMSAGFAHEFNEIVFFAPSRTNGTILELHNAIENRAITAGIRYTFCTPDRPLRDPHKLAPNTLAVIWPTSITEQTNLAKEQARKGNTLVFFDIPISFRLNKELNSVWSITCPDGQLAESRNEQIDRFIKTHPDYDRNHNGQLDFILMRGTEGNPVEQERSRILFSYLKKHHLKYNVVDEYVADWEFSPAYEHLKELIGTAINPLDIDMVIANNDDMALGAIGAMMQCEQFQDKIPPVFGIDGIGEAYMSIRDGIMQSVKMDIGITVDTLMQIYAHKSPAELKKNSFLEVDERRIFVPTVCLSKETLSNFQ